MKTIWKSRDIFIKDKSVYQVWNTFWVIIWMLWDWQIDARLETCTLNHSADALSVKANTHGASKAKLNTFVRPLSLSYSSVNFVMASEVFVSEDDCFHIFYCNIWQTLSWCTAGCQQTNKGGSLQSAEYHNHCWTMTTADVLTTLTSPLLWILMKVPHHNLIFQGYSPNYW